MIVFCEECGTKHIFEEAPKESFRCGNCGEMVRVAPPRTDNSDKVQK